MPTTITVEYREHAAVLWLDGPAVLNALGSVTFTSLEAALERCADDSNTVALVVSGKGRAFSAGADLAEIGSMTDASEFEDFIRRFTDVLALVEACPKPVIAAINGAALGGGLELALACDLRIAAESARLGLPEVAIGLIPGGGGTQRLLRAAPAAVARQMLIWGDPISAARAFQVGLVNEVVDEGSVLDRAVELANIVASRSGHAIAQLKHLLSATTLQPLADGIAMERATATALFAGPDRSEGLAAFRDRRPAQFTR